MKVKELIELLSKENPEAPVVAPGYEGGFGDVENVEHIKIILNCHTTWYYGPHESVDSIYSEEDKKKPITDAILLD